VSVRWGRSAGAGLLLVLVALCLVLVYAVVPLARRMTLSAATANDHVDDNTWKIVTGIILAAHHMDPRRFVPALTRLGEDGADAWAAGFYVSVLMFLLVVDLFGAAPSVEDLHQLYVGNAKQLKTVVVDPQALEQALLEMFGLAEKQMPYGRKTAVMAAGLGVMLDQPRRWLRDARPRLAEAIQTAGLGI